MAENFPNWIEKTDSLVRDAQPKHNKHRIAPKSVINFQKQAYFSGFADDIGIK